MMVGNGEHIGDASIVAYAGLAAGEWNGRYLYFARSPAPVALYSPNC